MPALVVANAAQMRLIWSLSGQLYALNVMGVVANAVPITQALTNTIGAAIKTSFGSTAYNTNMHTTVALANFGLRDIRTANQPEFVDTGAAVVGTGTGDLLPPQTALCVTLRTAQVGQSYRGRVYLPGFAESINTATGTATGTTLSINFVAAIQAALVANGLNLGVLSRPAPNATPARFGFITPVTSIVIRDAVWDTQRRRAVPGI